MNKQTLPKPVHITMRLPFPAYPFLEVGKTYTIPEDYAKPLLEHDFAELELIHPENAKILGRNSFEKKSKGKDEQDKEKQKTSLYIDEQYIYEQIKDATGNKFLRYDTLVSNLEYCDSVPGEQPLFPIDDEEVQGGHIKLPSKIEEYGSEKELIEAIEQHVYKYLDVPADYLHYAVLNIMKSWVYERYRSLNYLRVQGEPGTGKSRFLDVIGGLHYKPIATSGASTVAPIFRLINKWGCTLIMDEADLKQSDETNDLIKIINQGFEKDRPVIRCNPDNKSQVEFFNVYCPKVLSTRRNFEDVATESRCMTQIMTTTSRNIISSLNDEFYKEQQSLRNKLLLWRFRNFHKIQPDIGEQLDWKGIEPRLKQVNIGFASLIMQDPEYVQIFLKRIRDAQNQLINERSETTEGHIISACARLILENKPIVGKYVIEYAELTDSHGNKWKPRRIVAIMKTLGFTGTKLERIDGIPNRVYLYEPQVLLNLFNKYLAPDELADFIKEIKNLSGSLNHLHLPFIRNSVTIVTIVYEQGKKDKSLKVLGDTQENSENVTIPPPQQYNRYDRYNVTDKINKMKENGELFESEPGVYRMVKQ
jgi:hypothetical protein